MAEQTNPWKLMAFGKKAAQTDSNPPPNSAVNNNLPTNGTDTSGSTVPPWKAILAQQKGQTTTSVAQPPIKSPAIVESEPATINPWKAMAQKDKGLPVAASNITVTQSNPWKAAAQIGTPQTSAVSEQRNMALGSKQPVPIKQNIPPVIVRQIVPPKDSDYANYLQLFQLCSQSQTASHLSEWSNQLALGGSLAQRLEHQKGYLRQITIHNNKAAALIKQLFDQKRLKPHQTGRIIRAEGMLVQYVMAVEDVHLSQTNKFVNTAQNQLSRKQRSIDSVLTSLKLHNVSLKTVLSPFVELQTRFLLHSAISICCLNLSRRNPRFRLRAPLQSLLRHKGVHFLCEATCSQLIGQRDQKIIGEELQRDWSELQVSLSQLGWSVDKEGITLRRMEGEACFVVSVRKGSYTPPTFLQTLESYQCRGLARGHLAERQKKDSPSKKSQLRGSPQTHSNQSARQEVSPFKLNNTLFTQTILPVLLSLDEPYLPIMLLICPILNEIVPFLEGPSSQILNAALLANRLYEVYVSCQGELDEIAFLKMLKEGDSSVWGIVDWPTRQQRLVAPDKEMPEVVIISNPQTIPSSDSVPQVNKEPATTLHQDASNPFPQMVSPLSKTYFNSPIRTGTTLQVPTDSKHKQSQSSLKQTNSSQQLASSPKKTSFTEEPAKEHEVQYPPKDIPWGLTMCYFALLSGVVSKDLQVIENQDSQGNTKSKQKSQINTQLSLKTQSSPSESPKQQSSPVAQQPSSSIKPHPNKSLAISPIPQIICLPIAAPPFSLLQLPSLLARRQLNRKKKDIQKDIVNLMEEFVNGELGWDGVDDKAKQHTEKTATTVSQTNLTNNQKQGPNQFVLSRNPLQIQVKQLVPIWHEICQQIRQIKRITNKLQSIIIIKKLKGKGSVMKEGQTKIIEEIKKEDKQSESKQDSEAEIKQEQPHATQEQEVLTKSSLLIVGLQKIFAPLQTPIHAEIYLTLGRYFSWKNSQSQLTVEGKQLQSNESDPSSKQLDYNGNISLFNHFFSHSQTIFKLYYGTKSSQIALFLTDHAACLYRLGQLDEARKVLIRAITILRASKRWERQVADGMFLLGRMGLEDKSGKINERRAQQDQQTKGLWQQSPQPPNCNWYREWMAVYKQKHTKANQNNNGSADRYSRQMAIDIYVSVLFDMIGPGVECGNHQLVVRIIYYLLNRQEWTDYQLRHKNARDNNSHGGSQSSSMPISRPVSSSHLLDDSHQSKQPSSQSQLTLTSTHQTTQFLINQLFSSSLMTYNCLMLQYILSEMVKKQLRGYVGLEKDKMWRDVGVTKEDHRTTDNSQQIPLILQQSTIELLQSLSSSYKLPSSMVEWAISVYNDQLQGKSSDFEVERAYQVLRVVGQVIS